MSYAALSSFGLACPGGADGGGSTDEPCNGTERVCGGDRCCDTPTWNNGTYILAKGRASWRYYNERRIRALLKYLLSPTPHGSPSPIDDFAYDVGAGKTTARVPPELVTRIRAAQANFDAIFPASRWTQKDNCVPTDCTPSGYYKCYAAPAPNQTQSATIVRIAGLGSNPRDIGPMTNWLTKADQVINTVPGWSAQINIEATVKPGDPIHAGDVLTANLTAGKETVLAGPWLASFLSVFAPLPGKTMATTGASNKQLTVTVKSEPTYTPPPAAPEKSSAVWIVGGLLVVAGAGYYLYRRQNQAHP